MKVFSNGELVECTPNNTHVFRDLHPPRVSRGFSGSLLDCIYIELDDSRLCVFPGIEGYEGSVVELLSQEYQFEQINRNVDKMPTVSVVNMLSSYVVASAEDLCRTAAEYYASE